MRRFCLLGIFLWVLPIISFSILPDQVADWTEQTLLTTLNAGYHETVSEASNVRKQFKDEAWTSMQAFFEDNPEFYQVKPTVRFEPKPITPPTILEGSVCDSDLCWRVHQLFFVPELNRTIEFDAVVAHVERSYPSNFIIRTLDITVNP